ncbi:MAG: helix-turn-helix domain-containing protein [Clostridia bacterium]|nr:helix-turn-helix domain-containing protein [Clostridia bacterium]
MYGQILKELRKEKGWSQDELAKQLNTSQRTISRYERELFDLSTDMIIKICNLFDITSDYLLGLKDE